MNTTQHVQAIVTNARQGQPVSTRNRRRATLPPGLAVILALAAFWIVAGLVVALAR